MLFFHEKIAKIKQSLISIYMMCLIGVKINMFYQKFMMTHLFLVKIREFGSLDLTAFLKKLILAPNFVIIV